MEQVEVVRVSVTVDLFVTAVPEQLAMDILQSALHASCASRLLIPPIVVVTNAVQPKLQLVKVSIEQDDDEEEEEEEEEEDEEDEEEDADEEDVDRDELDLDWVDFVLVDFSSFVDSGSSVLGSSVFSGSSGSPG